MIGDGAASITSDQTAKPQKNNRANIFHAEAYLQQIGLTFLYL
ncbi:MAG TPA: hypothetical protein VHL50_09425 [Pyrinomonadaceae bacterium]|jgi:hypothetical protein|nr:hypothetical protein [Pyrinomonadaceae bacterium]